ncbi:MAG: dihydroorotate dehydrogenase electron transfer subunit [Chloroflexi bacterium]|nr:dihydroorotate dehydrogenase electron transfer subunit [Chloroflexota bacterium]
MKQVAASVISNEQLLGELERPHARAILGSWIIWLRCPKIAREAQPGQFVMVGCGEECMLPRPFSIHRVNEKSDMALLFSAWVDGKGTNWLSQRHTGDTIDLLGPLGNGFSISPASKNLLLIAGGIGIAPLYFLAQEALSHGGKIKLLQGASGAFKPSVKPNPSQLYPKELLLSEIELETITTTPDGKKGMVLELLTLEVVNWAEQIFACGPTAMYRDMALKKRGLGLEGKPVQISLEARMGCGRGVCYACTVRTKNGLKQVCQDGPVFDLDDIIWDEFAQA